MFEHYREPLLARRAYLLRLLRGFFIASSMVAFSLGLGMWGYHYFGRLGWVDALLNASMILTGMGPVDTLTTTGAKIFASFYALFSGVAFLTMVAVLFAPAIHRFFHRFHLDIVDDDENPESPEGSDRSKRRKRR